MSVASFAVVRQKSTGLYLRMTKFDPVTNEPLYGPLAASWIANSVPQAAAQAGFLGEEDHEVINVRFASSDLSSLEGSSPEQVAAILTNANTRIHLEVEVPRQDAQEMTMTQEQAKEMAAKWHELLGLADAADGSGNFDDAEAYRMKAADIEVDLAEAGFTASKLAAG